MIQSIITFFIITLPIGYAYYLDYKKDKKYFIESLKNLTGVLKYLTILAATIIIYKSLFPINLENYTEQNNIRLKNGLELLDNKSFEKIVDEQYKTEWWRNENNDVYFKKVIEYDLLGPAKETDYFKLTDIENGYIFKTFSYTSKKMNYFIEKPEGLFSKIETKEIDKENFNEYLKKTR